jgi:hypothetical protein
MDCQTLHIWTSTICTWKQQDLAMTCSFRCSEQQQRCLSPLGSEQDHSQVPKHANLDLADRSDYKR